MTSSACSDAAHRSTVHCSGIDGRLVVLEGLPGAGKTTAARALGATYPVIGEYANANGETTAMQDHPALIDGQAHQRNWLIKTRLAQKYLSTNPLVVCDRDWLSSLAYAYSTAPTDGGALLRQRCAWALLHLLHGALRLGDAYLILDVDAPTSLARRASRLRPDHPWSAPEGLARLKVFYRDPAQAIAPMAPKLAERLVTAHIEHLRGDRHPTSVLATIVAIAQRHT